MSPGYPNLTVLIVTTRGGRGTWAVYQQNDSPREPGTLTQTMGRVVGSVASWEELDALAEQHDVAPHQVAGAGLDEMEQVLGPQPNS
jgi:hypothetical protein